jgi:iron complex transport system substrate-binding protein
MRQQAFHTQLVGRTEFCNFPAIDPSVRVVMRGTKPNYELIANLKPGLVVYDADLFAQTDIDKFKELGIETFAIKGRTLDEFIDCLYRLGARVGDEINLSSYVDKIYSAREAAIVAAVSPKPKVAILMPGDGTEHMIAGLGSFQADVLRAAGAEPVGPDANQFVTMSAENLVSLNPDVVFVSGNAESVLDDPRLQSIAAVKNKRVAVVNPDVLLRRGVRVNLLISELSNALHAFMEGPAGTQ